MKFFWCS